MKKILVFLMTLLLLVPAFASAETRTNETTGYKAVLDDSGRVMPDTEHINTGSEYTVKMQDGCFTAHVTGVFRDEGRR